MNRSLCMLTIVVLGALTVFSQNQKNVEPKQLPKVTPKVKSEEEIPIDPKSDKIIIGSLKGIRFIANPDAIEKEGIQMSGIETKGFPLLEKPSFQQKIKAYLGKPASLQTLNQITKEVVLFYRSEDYPVVDAIVPEQALEMGAIQILVIEGKAGKISVEGNRWFDSQLFLNQSRVQKGQPLHHSDLLADVMAMNLNPFHPTDLIYARGEKFGETDILYRVHDRFPFRFYTGYEDTGNDITGDERWYMGFNWGNVFSQDHQLNYQFTTSSDFSKMTAHSGSYFIPLPWRHHLTFFGSYGESKADLPVAIDLKGRSWQASARYGIPLPGPTYYEHEFVAGFDFKQSNSSLDFGKLSVFNRTADVNQLVFGYDGKCVDEWGSTRFGITGFYSLGNLSERNHDVDFQAARALAEPEYYYGRFNLQRETQLPWNFIWSLKGQTQLADGNLLSSEQLGLGGYSTVRGYEENEALGDEGWTISNELRLPTFGITKWTGVSQLEDHLVLYGFWDYGVANNVDLLPGEDPHVVFSSVGPGLRYQLNSYLSVRFDYGFQLMDSGQSDGRRNSRAHLGVMLSF